MNSVKALTFQKTEKRVVNTHGVTLKPENPLAFNCLRTLEAIKKGHATMTNETNEPHSSGSRMFVSETSKPDPLHPARVMNRAQMIASIHGRDAESVSDEDLRAAWQELREEEGNGPIDLDLVEKRAREIAVINEREEGLVSEEDRYQAWCELHDVNLRAQGEAPQGARAVPRNPAEISNPIQHEKKPVTPPDEASFPDLEVQEGVEEAEHEKEYEGHKAQNEQ
jgi:hypothetical protein